jgi:hypothetical protein
VRESGATLARNAFMKHHGVRLIVLPFWQWAMCPHDCRESLVFKHVSGLVSADFRRYHLDAKRRIRGRERRAPKAFGQKEKKRMPKKKLLRMRLVGSTPVAMGPAAVASMAPA